MSETSRDEENAEYFRSGWLAALKEVVLLAGVQWEDPIEWARSQVQHLSKSDEEKK